MAKNLNTKNIARIAILGSIGAVLMVLDFPIAFIAPGFYKLDISNLPCLIGSFAMGPIPYIFIETVKILIKMLIKPTSTAFVGEITEFILSCILCIPAGIIYSKDRSKKGAIKAIVVSSILMVVASIIINYVFCIPFYAKLYGIDEALIISMGSKIFPIINSKLSFVLICVGLFNSIKAVIIDVLTIALYKHISPLLRSY